jgi:hypothetical protein
MRTPLIFCFTLLALVASAHAAPSIDFPVVKLRSLDKTSARTSIFEAAVGSTVKFGDVYIKVQACRKAPEMEQPEAAAFLQVWDVNAEEKAEWIFSGWMFASSPGLSAMDHPIYDVWVLDCLEQKGSVKAEEDHDEPQEGEGEISKDATPAAPAIDPAAAEPATTPEPAPATSEEEVQQYD